MLVNRLSLDEAFRNAVTSQAEPLLKRASAAPGSDGANPDAVKAQEDLEQLLGNNGLIPPPKRLCALLVPPQWIPLLGIFISALLLSLGAPFWYNALQNLLRLRSLVAQKDDQQRTTRQTTQTPDAAPKK